MRFDIITIFPEIFDSYFGESILKRAQEKKLIKIGIHDLRKFSTDRYKKVDDKAYGGGPGMVFKIEPIARAIGSILKLKVKPARLQPDKIILAGDSRSGGSKKLKIRSRIILFSTRGKKFDNKIARRLAKYDQLILICGRYEGVDERVAEYIADEEISIGDYVLTGGELPAMVVVDAVSRHIPGVLGKQESLEEIKGSYPVYTRPEIFNPQKILGRRACPTKFCGAKFWRVPKVLMSGDHKKIEKWRKGVGSTPLEVSQQNKVL